MYEWRKVYRDKEELMLERGFQRSAPMSSIVTCSQRGAYRVQSMTERKCDCNPDKTIWKGKNEAVGYR